MMPIMYWLVDFDSIGTLFNFQLLFVVLLFVAQVCARTMSKCDTVVPLMYAMKKRRDVIHTAAETIKKLYDLMIPELVEQVGVATKLVGVTAKQV